MVTSIGEKIAELRKERKMTQEDLAGLIGVSSQTVSKWETGVTMPDVLLLPTLAGIFEVTVDELFSIQRGQKWKSGPIEDIPDEVYDAVLDTMWMCDEGAEKNRIKKKLSDNPEMHTGFVSMKQGGVYADKNLALTYIADSGTSIELFESEKAGDFLRTLADPDVRKILKYQQEHRGIFYTVSSVSARCGVPEEKVKRALEALVRYALARKQTVDMGEPEGGKIDIYSHFGDHKFPLLVYPLLSIAETLSDFKENWAGLRS